MPCSRSKGIIRKTTGAYSTVKESFLFKWQSLHLPPHIIVHARAVAYVFCAFCGPHCCILCVFSLAFVFVCFFFNVKSVPIEIYTHSKCKPTSIRGIFNSPNVDKKRFRMKNGRKNPPKHTDKPHNLNVVQQRRSESRWYGYGNSDNINGICLTGWLVCTRDYSIKSVSSKREHWNSRKSLPILLFPCTMNQHHHHHRHLLCTRSVAFLVYYAYTPIERARESVSLDVCPRNSTMHSVCARYQTLLTVRIFSACICEVRCRVLDFSSGFSLFACNFCVSLCHTHTHTRTQTVFRNE